MKTKLLLIAATVGLALCGCEKNNDSAARQIEQLTQQIAALQAQQARQFESLSNSVSKLSVRMEINFRNVGEYMQTNFAVIDSNEALRVTALDSAQDARITSLSTKLSGISTALASIGEFESKQGTFIKACHDAESEKLGLIFDNTLEIHKSISDLRSDYLLPIKMKLNAN